MPYHVEKGMDVLRKRYPEGLMPRSQFRLPAGQSAWWKTGGILSAAPASATRAFGQAELSSAQELPRSLMIFASVPVRTDGHYPVHYME